LRAKGKIYLIYQNSLWHCILRQYAFAQGIKVSSFPELDLLALQFFQDNPEYMDQELTGVFGFF
jgi:hypothetical protein